MKASLLMLGLAVFGLGAGQLGAELATSGALWSRLFLAGAAGLYLGAGLVLSSLRPARSSPAVRARLRGLSERFYEWSHPAASRATAAAVPIQASKAMPAEVVQVQEANGQPTALAAADQPAQGNQVKE